MQVQDPSKKTSITSLLNPQEASRYPEQTQTPDLLVANQSHTVIYGNTPYDASNSYHLRTASWGAAEDHSRQIVPATQIQHHYQPMPTYSAEPQGYSRWEASQDFNQQAYGGEQGGKDVPNT